MNIEEYREYCLAKKGAEECMPFDDTSVVIKVLGKMFTLISLERNGCVVLKCESNYALELREHYEAIEPAFHFNKKYWNQLWLDRGLGDGLVRRLVDHSIEEAIKKVPKKLQKEYLSKS